MTAQPAYFERVREKAAARWDQLERDPELAGPWHQLFKQVQSPRHIVSELLQNADDAGASAASVQVLGDDFVFEHNGSDFAEEHFASLCRFGYSNKRALHTIGFRGIGFKSTFSLGDWVELQTPTLRVRFHKSRFTEPQWITESASACNATRVRVPISDQLRRREVEKNLEEWMKSPTSLLFFQNIRKLKIGDRELHWGSLGPGPVANSEWMALYDKPEEPILLVRSAPEPFPDDALAEIQQERMYAAEDAAEFPPCRVELVLGAPGRLYVVLPTGVETELPFACNAPFIQDPARLKIKDPETSPTNRWLLERVGALAAATMLQWLESTASDSERAQAYGLFPDVDRDDASLEGQCGALAEEAFSDAIDGKSFLLTEAGALTPASLAISIPAELLAVWPDGQAAALLDPKRRPALSTHIDPRHRRKLANWRLFDTLDRAAFVSTLETTHLPRPQGWHRLMAMWAFIAPSLQDYRATTIAPRLRIMPVQGRDALYAASESVRLGERRLLQSDEDWQFLAQHLIVLDQDWPRFLADQRRASPEEQPEGIVGPAYGVLEKSGFAGTSDTNRVMARVADLFFKQSTIGLDDAVRLAQIAAKLNAAVPGNFRFVTADRSIRHNHDLIIYDRDGSVEELLPPPQRQSVLLHPDYLSGFRSCSREEWEQWIASGNAGLKTFAALRQRVFETFGRPKIEAEARRRGVRESPSYNYVTNQFSVEDWDFDEAYWRHWQSLAAPDPTIWVRIGENILAQREHYWNTARHARIVQIATNGNRRSILSEPALPSWLLRLRELPCLRDNRGAARKPSDLLRRTPETEPLLDIEPFLDARLDRERVRDLLDLLGVRSTPTGPTRVLEILRAFAKSEKSPVHEVEKWYLRLDRMMAVGSTEDADLIRCAFQTERLILSQDGGWADAKGVFIAADEEDAPGAATIREGVRDLSLWRRVGVAERPNAELALAWLTSLPLGEQLAPDEVRRVRALLPRHASRIWYECGRWLNLAGQWRPVEDLAYALTMQSLVRWQHLHPWVKEKTADLQKLTAETCGQQPFSSLPLLAQLVDEKPGDNAGVRPNPCEWLNTLGVDLSRIVIDSEAETDRIRALGQRLSQTRIAETRNLEVTPYMDGTPAGTPRAVDAAWFGTVLHVSHLPVAKAAKRIPEEIGRAFGREDIKAALSYSFERASVDIRAYMAENFELAVLEKTITETSPATDHASAATDHSSAPEGAEPAFEPQPTPEPIVAAPEPPPQPDEPSPDPVVPPHRPREAAPPRTPLIERFAKSRGFRKDGDARYFHDDGSWLGRVPDSPFTWVHYGRNGAPIANYWVKEHCLEKAPLQVDAAIWGLIERLPKDHAFILAAPDETPTELDGATLLAMRASNTLTLYPATYRLVMNDDR